MWEAFADRVERERHPGPAEQPRAPRSAIGTVACTRVVDRGIGRDASGARRSTRVLSSIPLSASSSWRSTRPPPADVLAAARQAPLPRAVPRRADDRRRTSRSPTTGSTSTIPETRAGRVQNFGAWSAEHGRCRERRASGSSTSASRATSIWEMPDERRRRAGDRRARADRAARPRAGLRRRQGPRAARLSDVRRRLPRRRRRSSGRYLAQLREPRRPSAATACTATTTRITRCGRRSSRRST